MRSPHLVGWANYDNLTISPEIKNLVGVWGRNHARGHSALREQAQLTNYGVSSTDLYQHPIGTTYRVAAIS